MKPNTVVMSKAGRDSGQWFAAVELIDGYAMIVDGKSRPLSKPKRKKVKHLVFTDIALSDESLLTNRKIRSALKSFSSDCDKGGK